MLIETRSQSQKPPQLNKPTEVTSKAIFQKKPEGTAQSQMSLERGHQTRYIPLLQTGSGQQSRSRLIINELLPYPNPLHQSLPDCQIIYKRIRGLQWI